ncbi:MAG: hypothetical protein CHACPFDD_02602 [Phycisphaerae bacterium]|nr:hypothetical protein [Phycisphaerae bacterium]
MPGTETTEAGVIRAAVGALLTETFEGADAGAQTWFNDSGRDRGFIGLLGTVGASVAARAPGAGRKSIAQHVRHERFHLEVTLKLLTGDSSASDWDTSWNTNARDAASWQREIDAFRTAYLAVKRKYETCEWDELRLASALGTIAHAAYHLGAVRQMLCAGPA